MYVYTYLYAPTCTNTGQGGTPRRGDWGKRRGGVGDGKGGVVCGSPYGVPTGVCDC